MELSMYTGKLEYQNICFDFLFDGAELRLIPPSDKKNEVHKTIIMKEIQKGVFTMGDPKMNEAFLIGKCNETGRTIIFITKQGANIGNYNSVLFIDLAAYILCKSDIKPITKMIFTCAELDCIHPVSQGFSCTFKEDEFQKQGILSVTTEAFENTTTEYQKFEVDDKIVNVGFGISRTFNTKVGQPPLTLQSTMFFSFAPTNDYSFIIKLWFAAKEFLQYMCYRKNVFLPVVSLSTPAENNLTRSFATLNVLEEKGAEELKPLKNGNYIKLSFLSGKEGDILSDIAAQKLYTRHIPDTYDSGHCINAAKFVMITAAFEWEFKRLYPDGIKKKTATVEAEDAAKEVLLNLIENSKGKLKALYRALLKNGVGFASMQSKIIHMGKDMDNIITLFGNHLYSLNSRELKYSKMGERLASQRNHYAHGDLDEEFIGDSLLDLIYLERIIYAMQLKFYNIEEKNIQKAINDLFNCGIVIE